MAKLIHYDVHNRVATVTLNRPDKRNALNADLVTALQAAFAEAASDDSVRVIVLTGAGKVFSAGADLVALEALQSATPMENVADSEHLAALFEQIYLHPKPVIARVNGHAIAGGCGLAAVCDFSIAAAPAKLGFTETRIGFVPAIVMVFVLRKLGEAAARDLLLRGALITAEAAAALGLITRAVSAETLDAAVDELAQELATQMNAFARGTPDCQAGIAAFLNKTDPPWRAGS